jgi:hypothetical protein
MRARAWAGSGGEGGAFAPQLTSYDYDAPLSEAGGTGQPGIGGPDKFQVPSSALESLFMVLHRRSAHLIYQRQGLTGSKLYA